MKKEPVQVIPSWGNDKWSDPDAASQRTVLSGSERRLVFAFSKPYWPKPCTTKDLADIAGMTKREAANKLRGMAKRGIVRQWHTDKSGQRRYGCVCWSLCENVKVHTPLPARASSETEVKP